MDSAKVHASVVDSELSNMFRAHPQSEFQKRNRMGRMGRMKPANVPLNSILPILPILLTPPEAYGSLRCLGCGDVLGAGLAIIASHSSRLRVAPSKWKPPPGWCPCCCGTSGCRSSGCRSPGSGARLRPRRATARGGRTSNALTRALPSHRTIQTESEFACPARTP